MLLFVHAATIAAEGITPRALANDALFESEIDDDEQSGNDEREDEEDDGEGSSEEEDEEEEDEGERERVDSGRAETSE